MQRGQLVSLLNIDIMNQNNFFLSLGLNQPLQHQNNQGPTAIFCHKFPFYLKSLLCNWYQSDP